MRKKICTAIFVASMIWTLSLGGAIDLDTLPLRDIVAQGIMSCSLMFVSAKIGGII